jgi:hypothetical protein
VSGGHHGHHGHHGGITGLFDFGKLGNIVNFGNLVIEQNIAVQIAVAVGTNASATNLLGGQLNFSSIA